jgi:hypothetical protein
MIMLARKKRREGSTERERERMTIARCSALAAIGGV